MRYLLTILTLALMPMLSFAAPGYTVKIDTQQTDPEFRIRTIKRGETPTIKAKLYENGTIYTNLSGWGSTFAIYTNSTSTSIWSFPHTTIAANVVTYDLDAIGLPEGRYRAEFIFTNATRTVSFGKIGRVWVEESAGIGSSVTNVLTTPINFDLFTESGTIDGATLTNITLTGLSAVLNDLSDVNSVTTPTVGHVLSYAAAGWTNAATASADTRLDNTTATNAVNMGDFDIDAVGDINMPVGKKMLIGSPTNEFTAFPLHIQADTTFDLDSSFIDPDLTSSHAGILISGEDALLQLVSKDEGGHGSSILQSEYDTSGNFVQSWVTGVGATTSSKGSFYIGHTRTNSYSFGITIQNAPLNILTNGQTVIGGLYDAGGNKGLRVYGKMGISDIGNFGVSTSGTINIANNQGIYWEAEPQGDNEPGFYMDANEALVFEDVTGITFGSAVLSEAELEILDGATITTAETDTLSDGSNADSLHVHASAGVSSLVDADMANDALDADKIIGDAVDDDDLDLAVGGTGQSLVDPAADGIMLWDDSDSGAEWDFAAIGTGLSYDGTTLTAAGAGDSVSIDGVGVVDPDFVSTGDIDFIDTSNTITADINSGADYTSDNVTISNLTVQTSLLGISTFTLSVSQLVANVIDTVGAADMDYGSDDVTDHTFTSDGGTVILDGTIDPSGAILLDATAGMSDGANSFFDFGGTAAGGDLSVSLGDNDIAGSGLQIEILATSEAIELKNTAQTAQVSVWGDLDADIITADEVVNIENADTTIARDSAGVLSVEGNVIHHTGGTDITDADISDTLTASITTTATAGDNDTSIASTAFVQEARPKSIAIADLGDTATPSVLTTEETTNKIISNYQSSGADHVFTMPAAHAAGNVIFPIGDEFQVDVEPNTSDLFYLNGTAMAADEHIQNTADTLGERLVGYCVNINGTLRWMFYSSDAAWVEATP